MKRNILPNQIISGLFLLSSMSLVYLARAVAFGSRGWSFWVIFIFAAAVACLALDIVFAIPLLRKKKLKADEFCTGVLLRSGCYAFIFAVFSITFFFLGLGLVMLLNEGAAELTDLLDMKLVLALFAAIQLIFSIFFTVYYYSASKKGGKLKSFSTKIKVLREEMKLSQEELANKVGVRRETIVHLENNKYMPSLKLALDIAKTFGKPIEEIFFEEE